MLVRFEMGTNMALETNGNIWNCYQRVNLSLEELKTDNKTTLFSITWTFQIAKFSEIGGKQIGHLLPAYVITRMITVELHSVLLPLVMTALPRGEWRFHCHLVVGSSYVRMLPENSVGKQTRVLWIQDIPAEIHNGMWGQLFENRARLSGSLLTLIWV